MRFFPNIRYGTERYPEKVARRLRAVNIAAWLAAATIALLAFARLTDPERWQFGAVTVLFAVAIAAVPLLHRFGSLAAPLALTLLIYAHIFRIVYNVGTGDGAYLTYLTGAALGLLLIGVERIWLAASLAALAAALILLLHMLVPYNTGQLPPRLMFLGNFAVNVVMNTVVLFVVVLYAVRQTARAEETAEREYDRSEALLQNILPPKVAARLKDRGAAGARVIADRYDEASILFADMAGFTARASDTAPDALVRFLDDVFTKLDGLVERHGLEKIKTTGDAYMVVSGVPEGRPDHAEAMADLALDMRDALAGLVDPEGRAVPVRFGIASGAVVAGVVGTRKFFYDVWGDPVNIASRMESTGEVGKIQVAPETYQVL
ncbi:MAG: adenylate/guanylate cyclase domain-containing protein, partial [Planctomycetes bacterium]|nr:adenylate/guanylate cyclase domain-containing protein [Planctomycetota bacterium]